MDLPAQTATTSKAMYRTGWIITVLVGLFMLFDASVKLLKAQAAVEGTVKLGYPAHLVFPIGVAALASVVFYVIPRTAVFGAILLTGYFGGATATQVRVEDPWFIFPVFIGMLAWAGVYFRDARLRALIPLRKV